MPGITMPGYIATGGRNMRTDSSSTLYRLQPRSQPERTGLEAYPAAMLTQPILPATQRGHRLRRGAIRTVGRWQRYFAAIMRNYLILLCCKIDTSTPKLRAGQERMC